MKKQGVLALVIVVAVDCRRHRILWEQDFVRSAYVKS